MHVPADESNIDVNEIVAFYDELYLNKEIYDEKYIQIAIQAYQGLAEISYKLNACWWMCSFTATRYDIDLTKKEFENYLIALMNRGLSNEVM